MCSNPQVLYIYTRWVVANMHDNAAFRQLAIFQNPSHTVSQNRVLPITIKDSVSVFLAGCPLNTATFYRSGFAPKPIHLDRASGRLAVLPFGIVVEPTRYFIGLAADCPILTIVTLWYVRL